MIDRCPLCGKDQAACIGTHGLPYDPSKVFDLYPEAPKGAPMAPKAKEDDGKTFTMPQQHVRPGRGVPGYTGNVTVIPTKPPASYTEDGGIGNLAEADAASRGTVPAPRRGSRS